MNGVNNPLLNYTRQESIYIKLPSQGHFYNPGDVTFTANGEVGIRPLCAADELALNNPDALMNGDAVTKVIRSCVPAVKDPSLLVAPDIDAILAAVRLATYGEFMEVTVECPKCKHQNEFEAPIQYSLDTMKFLESEYPVQLSEKTSNLTVFVRPFTFVENTKEAIRKFNETKAISLLLEKDLDDENVKREYQTRIEKISDITISVVASCVVKIIDADGNELNASYEHIEEWIKNIPASDAHKIINKVEEINKTGINRDVHVSCTECGHTWDTELEFDPAYFFDFGS